MGKEPRILILEDVATDAELVLRELRKAGIVFTSRQVQAREAFLQALNEFAPDLILSDYNLPQFTALDALRLLKEHNSNIPLILVTGSLTEELAVQCMKEGADDYILKTSLKRLPSAVINALGKREAELDKERAEAALRQSEEQLQQSQKLEAVGQLAGGVAHDFNNLLTVINGYADMLLTMLPQDELLTPKIEEILKAGQRAGSLTRQLLAFSRKQVLQPQVIAPNSLVADVSRMLRRLIGENIELVTVLGSSRRISADPGQIEQVLMNLVINARDAMPQGGKVIIETVDEDLDESYAGRHAGVRPGQYVKIAVSDTGTGMDAETQKHIFEPFFTTKEAGKGTGLGLSTVYGIVKQSGGHIWVYSEAEKGTTFKIYFPRLEEEAESIKPRTVEAALPRGTGTILLVEDEAMVRGLARKILQMNGYRVVEAANGEEALRVCERHEGTIDLLLTDVVMPLMNGRELAERLTPMRPQMRVLYMSGYTDDAIVHHGVLEAGTAFLEKPFTSQVLTRKVREVLDR